MRLEKKGFRSVKMSSSSGCRKKLQVAEVFVTGARVGDGRRCRADQISVGEEVQRLREEDERQGSSRGGL
jgi:hypothetical protein